MKERDLGWVGRGGKVSISKEISDYELDSQWNYVCKDASHTDFNYPSLKMASEYPKGLL